LKICKNELNVGGLLCFLITVEGKEFVRDGPQFSARQSAGFQSPFGGFGQRKSTAPEASAGNIPFLTYALKYVIVISVRWYTCIKISILGAK
jgi:hypothetical protein